MKDLVLVTHVKSSGDSVARVEEPHALVYINDRGTDVDFVLYSILEPILTAYVCSVDAHGGKYLQTHYQPGKGAQRVQQVVNATGLIVECQV